MNQVTVRPNPAIAALCAGIVLGAALAAGGCAKAEKKGKPPVLPAARFDYTRAAGPRQVFVTGRLPSVDERVNNLLLQGWRIVPGSVALVASGDGGAATAALEYKPALPQH